MSSFGERLKKLRKQRGLTQKQLAVAVGIGQTAIANYEQGNRRPDSQGLLAIAEALEVSVDVLLGHTTGAALGNRRLHPNGGGETRRSSEYGKGNERSASPSPAELYSDGQDVDCNWEMEYLLELCSAGEADGAVRRMQALAELDLPVNRIYREILEPVLLKSQEQLAQGIAGCPAYEITECVQRCTVALRSYMKRKPGNGKRFLGMVFKGETYGLPLMLVYDYLYMEGWDVMYAGSYLSGDENAEVVRCFKPDVLGLSVASRQNIAAAEQLISLLKDENSEHTPLILVSGEAFADDAKLWQSIHADALAHKGVEAVAMLNRLMK